MSRRPSAAASCPLAPAVQKEIKRLKGKLRAPDGPETWSTVVGPMPAPGPLAWLRAVEWPPGARFFARRRGALPHELMMSWAPITEAHGAYGDGPHVSVAWDDLQYHYFALVDIEEPDPVLWRVDHAGLSSEKGTTQRLSQLLAGFRVDVPVVEDVVVTDANLWSRLDAYGARKTQKSLNALRDLNASHSGVTDISALRYCARLERLELWGNRIADLTPLSALGRLRTLSLDATGDLGPLASLAALESLEIHEPPTLAPLAALSALRKLKVRSRDVAAPDLGTLPATLTELALQGASFGPRLAALSALTALERLEVDGTEVDDLGLLKGLTRLRELRLRGPITDLGPLADLTALGLLFLFGTRSSDASPLSSLTELVNVTLSGPCRDLAFTRGLAKLTTLWVLDGQIEDLSPLAGALPALSVLGLSGPFRDLGPLAGKSLYMLSLSSDALEDLSPLAGLAGLGKLTLQGTRIRDLSPLAAVPELKGVTILCSPGGPRPAIPSGSGLAVTFVEH